MQTLRLKYNGEEIEPELTVQEPAERTASDIAAEWRDTEDTDFDDQEDILPDEAKEYVFDETDVQDLSTESDEF